MCVTEQNIQPANFLFVNQDLPSCMQINTSANTSASANIRVSVNKSKRPLSFHEIHGPLLDDDWYNLPTK